jgi:hypothetical protein
MGPTRARAALVAVMILGGCSAATDLDLQARGSSAGTGGDDGSQGSSASGAGAVGAGGADAGDHVVTLPAPPAFELAADGWHMPDCDARRRVRHRAGHRLPGSLRLAARLLERGGQLGQAPGARVHERP